MAASARTWWVANSATTTPAILFIRASDRWVFILGAGALFLKREASVGGRAPGLSKILFHQSCCKILCHHEWHFFKPNAKAHPRRDVNVRPGDRGYHRFPRRGPQPETCGAKDGPIVH